MATTFDAFAYAKFRRFSTPVLSSPLAVFRQVPHSLDPPCTLAVLHPDARFAIQRILVRARANMKSAREALRGSLYAMRKRRNASWREGDVT